MGERIWKVDLEDGPHTVRLRHGYWSGKRKIDVDGQPVELEDDGFIVDFGGVNSIKVGAHEGRVDVWTPNGLTYKYALSIDGQPVDTDAPVRPNRLMERAPKTAGGRFLQRHASWLLRTNARKTIVFFLLASIPAVLLGGGWPAVIACAALAVLAAVALGRL